MGTVIPTRCDRCGKLLAKEVEDACEGGVDGEDDARAVGLPVMRRAVIRESVQQDVPPVAQGEPAEVLPDVREGDTWR